MYKIQNTATLSPNYDLQFTNKFDVPLIRTYAFSDHKHVDRIIDRLDLAQPYVVVAEEGLQRLWLDEGRLERSLLVGQFKNKGHTELLNHSPH